MATSRYIPIALLLACTGKDIDDTPEPDTTDTVVTDTDPPVDTVDSDPPVDTVDSDPPVDTVDSDPPDTDPPEPNHTLTTTPVACADPSLQADARYDLLHAAAVDDNTVAKRVEGGGIAMGDVDLDGRLDILLLGVEGVDLRMQTAPMNFVTDNSRLGGVDLTHASGATMVDHDGDGDLDLFITRFEQPNVLLANDGAGVFTDVTAASGITGSHRSQTSSWGDMDGDGDLDLFVGNYGPRPEGDFGNPLVFAVADPSQLWENQGDGTYIDRSDILLPSTQDGHTFMATWIDVDLDNDLDLWVVNDFGATRPSQLYVNLPSGLFPDASSGLNLDISGMGVGIGDLNADEIPDFLITSFRSQELYVSRTSGFWAAEGAARSLNPDTSLGHRQIFGWGAELADMDNDGDDDAIVTFGWWDEYAEEPEQRDGFWVQDATGQFADEAAQWNLDDPSANRGLLTVDINNDGSLDLVKRRLGRSTTMYVSRCDESAWLRVRPRMATSPNTHAVGARVRVIGPDRVWSRHIVAGGSSMYASTPAEVHVGLDSLDEVEVEVVWPDGEVSNLGMVDTRQILDVTRIR